ncbi:hypothetical protein [Legionella sp. km772]|uniref:hypothetical protein n=1 Tax=Legionella sp. km772 TaxID=2498111 RepID=UPI000F8D3AD4|nr:hypothetical protein [Legionella sp. km772]RUR06307.1 hypothetical protein ELY15_13350 [Legionella sp. km772]
MPNSTQGYASHPDSSKNHEHVDQKKWLKESKEVITKLVAGLPVVKEQSSSGGQKVYSSFADAYYFLAEERQRVAIKLEHGKKSGRTMSYGLLRGEGVGAREAVWETSQYPQPWFGMRDKLFSLVREQIKKIEAKHHYDSSKEKTYQIEDEFCMCSKEEEESPDGIKINFYHLTVKSPAGIKSQGAHSTHLARIYLRELVNKTDKEKYPEANLLLIDYAWINKYDTVGDFKLADNYFQALLKVPGEGEEKIKVFLERAGTLSHLLAHLLPTELGNSGIVEWMIRGLAFKNGIDLGPFNYAEGISWDFKALLSLDRNEYAHWYAEKAFVKVRLLAKEQVEQGFEFRQLEIPAPSSSALSRSGLGGFIKPAATPKQTELLYQAMPKLGGWYKFSTELFALQCDYEGEAEDLRQQLAHIFQNTPIKIRIGRAPSNMLFLYLQLPEKSNLAQLLDAKKAELLLVHPVKPSLTLMGASA